MAPVGSWATRSGAGRSLGTKGGQTRRTSLLGNSFGIRALYELGNEVISLREKESVGERLPQTKSAGGILKKAAKA